MKKLLVFCMALSMFVACNNKKDSKDKYDRDKTESKEKEKDDYSNTEKTDAKDEKTTQDDQSSSGWAKSDESRFMTDCEGTATPKVGAARANEYCDCMLQKLKAEYSSYQQADRELTTDAVKLNRLAAECNGQ